MIKVNDEYERDLDLTIVFKIRDTKYKIIPCKEEIRWKQRKAHLDFNGYISWNTGVSYCTNIGLSPMEQGFCPDFPKIQEVIRKYL